MPLSLFKFAFSNKYISEDLTINFSYLKKERPTPDPLSEDELSRLVSCCPDTQARNMLILSVYTGLRPGELSAGADPAFIAAQMGRTSSKMVHDVYGSRMPEYDQDQISLLNQKLNQSVPYVSPMCPQAITQNNKLD